MLVDGFVEIETVADLARALRQLRRREAHRRGEATVTYRQLAVVTGWSRSSIGEYFAGRTLPPTERFDVLIRLLGAVGVEQGALATARDRVEERRRTMPANGAHPDVEPPSALCASPIVGRDAELAMLARQAEAARRGAGGAVFLLGEPGMGKSRLAKEIHTIGVAAGMRLLRGRASSPAVRFRALSEALFSVLRHDGLPDEPDLAPYRAALSRLIPEYRLPHPLGTDDSLVELAEAVLRLLASISRPGGCALVLDDLQDADEDTLAVLDYLADNVVNVGVLLVGLVRPGPGMGADLAHACRQRGVAAVLELSRLDDVAIGQLAAGCLGVPPGAVPTDVLAHLAVHAEGNPFHAQELLTTLVADGHIVRRRDGWRVTGLVPRVP